MFAIFPKLYNAIKLHNINEISLLIRKYFNPSSLNTNKINLNKLIENIGIQVKTAPISNNSLGFIVAKDENGIFDIQILINSNYNFIPFEKDFLIAHLLGHLFFDIQPKIIDTTWINNGFKETCSPLQRYLTRTNIQKHSHEDFIDEFAISLFINEHIIEQLKMSLTQKPQNIADTIKNWSKKLNIPNNVLNKKLEEIKNKTIINKHNLKPYATFKDPTQLSKDIYPKDINNNIRISQHNTKQAIVAKSTRNPDEFLKKIRKIAKKIDANI